MAGPDCAAPDYTGPDYTGLIQPDRVHGSLYTDPRVFAGKQVLLVNRDQPLPTLAFLIL